MDYALKERIGKPELFTGRKEELSYFLNWINDIKDEKSQSTAVLARRKMGKTAIMERLFNITFYKNNGVIPFYYEIKEIKMWVGWLMNELDTLLPNRFWYEYLENMPEDEAVEMIYKYSRFFDVPITEETAYLIFKQTEGSPFYINSIIRSRYRGKDLTTVDGLTDTLEFETLDRRGNIKNTWMEYVLSTFKKVNGKDAKNIVLYLCQHRDREVTRGELLEKLPLDLEDSELEEKLDALVKGDIISQGQTHFDYRGVQDNIFDKVFRGVYEKEIREFDVRVIKKEYSEEHEKLKKQYDSLLGKDFKTKFAEIKKRESLERVVGLIFSRSGFTKEAEEYCKEKGIACSEDEKWLDTGK